MPNPSGGLSIAKLIAQRIGSGVLVLVAVSMIVFGATYGLGDPVRAMLGNEATPERVRAVAHELGTDRSLVEQYIAWVEGLLTNEAKSFATGRPVSELLGPRLLNSMILAGSAGLVAVLLGVAGGIASAFWRDRSLERLASLISLVLVALPEFVTGIFLVALLSTGVLHLLPAVYIGSGTVLDPLALILPMTTLVLAAAPYILQLARATMIEVLESDYVRMARLKGISELRVVMIHALPNAIGPIVQTIAIVLAWLAGGVVVVEFLFRFPGIGTAMADAVTNRDLPTVQAISLLIAGLYIVLNILADVIGLLANPRVRHGSR